MLIVAGMRRTSAALALIAASLVSGTALAGSSETQIHLLVMGPGEHLYTRGGHAALMVVEMEDGAPPKSAVYNFGDTHWDDPMLVPNFLRGELTFFLSDTGELVPTLEEYGVKQGRAVTRQRLNLTPEEAAEVARRLREGVEPGKREYTFHHRHALCSTKIMDLLDEVLKGRLRAELAGTPGPETGRHYQELVFSGSPLASIAGDLFMGRLHDTVLDRYESAAYPPLMSDYLHSIQVPAPLGEGEMVPLAEAPVPLVETTEPVTVQKSAFSQVLWGALLAALAGLGVSAHRGATSGVRAREAAARARAAKTVFWTSVASGVVGLLILAFIVLSRVPELRYNELILLFWPTDLWLAWRMRRAGQGAAPDRWVRGYVGAKLAVAGLVTLGHVAGVLYQEPRILGALGTAAALAAWALVRVLGAVPAAAIADTAPATVKSPGQGTRVAPVDA